MLIMLSSEVDNDLHIRQRNYGSRRRDRAGHDGRALCAPCYIVCFLLDLTKMKTRTRITLTWFNVIMCACVSGGLVAKYHYKNELTASPGDMRKIDMVSATFCQAVTVKSSTRFTIIKFFKTPKITNSFSKKKINRVSTSLNYLDEYQYWGFYLLKGSKMTAHVHVCGRAYLYKIVGKDKLDKWTAGSDRKSYDGDRLVNECTSGMYNHSTDITITAKETAQYYLLFYNSLLSNKEITKINVDFLLQRKYYGIFPNVSTIECFISTECTVPLAPEETIVYYVPDYEEMAEISVISICKPRLSNYILIFGIGPLLIGSLFTIITLKFPCKRNRERERRESRIFNVSGTEDGSTNAFTNPNFHLQLSPPSIDEVQATSSAGFSDAPPSYDEAVRHIINNNCNHGNNDNCHFSLH